PDGKDDFRHLAGLVLRRFDRHPGHLDVPSSDALLRPRSFRLDDRGVRLWGSMKSWLTTGSTEAQRVARDRGEQPPLAAMPLAPRRLTSKAPFDTIRSWGDAMADVELKIQGNSIEVTPYDLSTTEGKDVEFSAGGLPFKILFHEKTPSPLNVDVCHKAK